MTRPHRPEPAPRPVVPLPEPAGATPDPHPEPGTMPVGVHKPADAVPLAGSWRGVTARPGIPFRTLQRELAAGRFVRPIRYAGRRPYFKSAGVIAWPEGGARP
jgi:hypothetical protein